MIEWSLAIRNLLRNRRRSLSTLLALAVGLSAVLLFSGFKANLGLTMLTGYVRTGGHLQVQHRDYFLYGSGNPSAYGITEYASLVEVIRADAVLKPMISVVTPVLRFALDEARLRKGTLCVLYVKELAVLLPEATRSTGRSRWQDDPQAAAIMSLMLKLGQEVGVDVLPVYAVSTNPASTILDLAATLGVDFLMLGASHRVSMARLLKGNVVDEVARGLPEDIQLIIHS